MTRTTQTKVTSEYGPLSDVQLHLVDDVDTAGEMMRWLGERRNILSFDTETSGFSPWKDDLRLLQFGDQMSGWAIPWDRWGGVAQEVFSKYDGPWALHNRPFDANFAQVKQVVKRFPWERSHCTMVMAHVLDPVRPKGLKPLTSALVDRTAASGQEALARYMRASNHTWGSVPIDNPYYWGYGAMDTVLTSRLFDVFAPDIKATALPSYELELAVQRICANMTRRGTPVDLVYCNDTANMLRGWVKECRAWAKETFGVRNVTSAMQAIKVFEEDGIEFVEFTDNGNVRLDKTVLKSIDHPLATAILKIRRAEKLCSTYLDNFAKFADELGLIHPTIWTCGTRTARMSITDPAFQTLPKDDKTVRNGVIPDLGHRLISCDADQIEMRLMAHFAHDEGLIEAFAQAAAAAAAGSIDPVEIDFFCRVATEMYGTVIDKENPLRKITKNSSYARLYGAGAQKIATTAGVPRAKIEEINELMDARFPGVKRFMKEIEYEVGGNEKETGRGFVMSHFGRRLPVDKGKNYTGTNYKIQCSAAEIFKRALVALDAAGYTDYMLLPVHDEIVLSVPVDEAVDARHEIAEIMTRSSEGEFMLPITWSADILEGAWGGRLLEEEKVAA
jgi:DNA polymerase-1